MPLCIHVNKQKNVTWNVFWQVQKSHQNGIWVQKSKVLSLEALLIIYLPGKHILDFPLYFNSFAFYCLGFQILWLLILQQKFWWLFHAWSVQYLETRLHYISLFREAYYVRKFQTMCEMEADLRTLGSLVTAIAILKRI